MNTLTKDEAEALCAYANGESLREGQAAALITAGRKFHTEDLRREPHGWRYPKIVRVKVQISEVT